MPSLPTSLSLSIALAALAVSAPQALGQDLPPPPGKQTLAAIDTLSPEAVTDFWCGAAFMDIARRAVDSRQERAFDALASEFLGSARDRLIAEGHPAETFPEIGLAFGGMVMGDVTSLPDMADPDQCLAAGGYDPDTISDILGEPF